MNSELCSKQRKKLDLKKILRKQFEICNIAEVRWLYQLMKGVSYQCL
jgi:hypothetical protein